MLIGHRAMSQLPISVDRFLFGYVIEGLDYQGAFEKSQFKAVRQLLSVLSYASGITADFWNQPLKQPPPNNTASETTTYNSKKQYSKQENPDLKTKHIEAKYKEWPEASATIAEIITAKRNKVR